MFHTKTKKTVIIAEILIAVNNYVRVNYLSVLVHLFCNESHKLFQSIWDGDSYTLIATRFKIQKLY